MKWLKVILPAWVLLVVSGCTAFKAVKYGNPSVDTYRHFALDTIARSDTVRKVLISDYPFRIFAERIFGNCRGRICRVGKKVVPLRLIS